MLSNYKYNQASLEEIKNHLWRVNTDFKPALSSYVDINTYAEKLKKSAILTGFYNENELIGLVASYFNPDGNYFFITNFSIEKKYRGEGAKLILGIINYLRGTEISKSVAKPIKRIGDDLIKTIENIIKKPVEIKSMHIEVRKENKDAIVFYKKIGFRELQNTDESTYLIIDL